VAAIAATGLGELRYPPRTMRRICSLLCAVFLLVFLVGLSPHLVHHVFDPHDDLAAPEACALSTAAERHHPGSAGEVALNRGPDPVAPAHPAERTALPSRTAAPPTARAPPVSTS